MIEEMNFLSQETLRFSLAQISFFCSKLGNCEIIAFDFLKLEALQVLSRIRTKNCHINCLHD